MIFFTDREYHTVAIADYDTERGLRLLDDELNESIESGTAIYTATIDKNDSSVANIESGNFVFVPNFKGRTVVLEIMELEENQSTKRIIAEDAGLQLINSDIGPMEMKGTLSEFVKTIIGEHSDWEIGIDEIGNSKNLTLEYEGVTNQTERLTQVAGRFGAEISYSFDFKGPIITHKYINLHKKRGQNNGVRLEVGKDLKNVKRNISVTNLRTAVLGIGQMKKEIIKTEKQVTKKVKKPVEVIDTQKKEDQGKLKSFIDWFKQREGKVRYSMSARMGPNSYDCSSAVFFAAKHAGLIPKSQWIGNTETLFGFKGKYLDEINRKDIKYGDIFVAGRQGASGGAGGHTGAVLNKNQIIHCTGGRGIVTTKIDGWTGGPPVRWFRWKNSGYSSGSSPSKGKYWTNNNLIHHDLGFKLNTLTATQINNWVKATSPSSPFNGQGNVFMEAQKQSGLDARYILAHAALESAWGQSNIAKKYNNYFGIGAFDSNPENAKNYSNSGLAAGIIGGANWIAKNYYNSKYRQTTLYKMRHNNGVHQYATDPNWHTKIANVMKRSERFTTPSKATKTVMKEQNVTETIVEEKEIERQVTLKGYKYDDGRYFVDEKGRLCDKEANNIWSKPSTKGKYITRIYNSQATSEKTLFDECMLQLTNNNEPEVSYQVDPENIPDNVDIGDTVRIIDHDYNPPLYLEARLIEVTTSTTTGIVNKAVFANFKEQSSGISARLRDLQSMIQSQQFNWDSLPYTMHLESSNGSIFKDDLIDTNLIAYLKKAGIDQSANMDGFIWERISRYPEKNIISDEEWNEQHVEHNEHLMSITRSDVELEATFVCSAILDGTVVATSTYTIKNFSIGIFKQQEEPNRDGLMWGDVWQWDDGQENQWKRIWKGNAWEDTVTKRDLELIELMPGPPGQDGERGVPGPPGKDGRTPYIHLAYAESADGVVGFTLTASPGKDYIGLAHSFDPKDPTDPKAYEWSKFTGKDGADGIPGKPGKDGRTPYTHFAYANSADGSKDFSVSDSKDKDYLGVYTDYEKADSQDPKKYHWQLVRGPKGPKGDKGDPGKDGVPGKPGVGIKNTTISYAIGKSATQYPSTGWSAQVPKTTQGDFLWTKMQWSYTDGTRETGYTVSYIAEDGNDGTNGTPGKDGVGIKSSTVHYAKNQSGTQRPSSGWTVQVPETKPGDYLWSRLTLTYDDNTTEEVYNASHIGKDGAKGEKGDRGPKGADGKDGKTGQLGQNLLIKSNEEVTTTNYLLAQYDLAEVPEDDEELTLTVKLKEPLKDGRWLRLYNGGDLIDLGYLKASEDDNLYRLTFKWKNFVNPSGRLTTPQGDFIRLYHGPNNNERNPEITIDWAVLARGDIPANDWYNSYEEMQSQINNKAEQDRVNEIESQQQALEVYVESIPTPEELRRNSATIARHQAYLDQLAHAITSDKLTLEERIKIIEANVGAGKLSIEAINTYLDVGEEGVLIGRQGEQVKMTLDNDSLEIVDGTKVVARFSNNQSEIVNLKVTGTMEFGYHLVEKLEQGGKRFTTIKPI